LERIILNIDIGWVINSSKVPVLVSSAKHRMVNAGNKNIKIPGACEKNVCKLDSPISIMLLFPGSIQTKNPELIKKTIIAA
jgi:hypothetical protein